jgi:hypothetical protein
MPRIARAKPKAAAVAPAEPEPSVDEMRFQLGRKLEIMVSDWRQCPRRVCKRLRNCAPTNPDCVSPRRPHRVLTPRQQAAAMASLHRAVRRRLAELGEEE